MYKKKNTKLPRQQLQKKKDMYSYFRLNMSKNLVQPFTGLKPLLTTSFGFFGPDR